MELDKLNYYDLWMYILDNSEYLRQKRQYVHISYKEIHRTIRRYLNKHKISIKNNDVIAGLEYIKAVSYRTDTKGRLYYYVKKFKEAGKSFKRCLALNSAFPAIHRELGLLYLHFNRCDIGKNHINLYLRTASYIDDYGALEEQISECGKK